MDGQGHNESKNNKIDVDKLTKEAEAGHGHYLRSTLDQVSFEEQIHIARAIADLNKAHTKLTGYPKIEVFTQDATGDMYSENGYVNLKLYRKAPDRCWGQFFPRRDLIYESSLNLSTGEKIAIDTDL
jgi:hypothetical protein